MGEDPSRTQPLVFLNLIHPPARGVKAWFEKLARRRIQAELRSLSAPGVPCLALPELQSVTREDVMEWFSLHNIYDTEELRLKASETVFSSAGRQAMAEVEPRLRKLHMEFVANRGYL